LTLHLLATLWCCWAVDYITVIAINVTGCTSKCAVIKKVYRVYSMFHVVMNTCIYC
jgi:hypothetical protein